MPKKYKAKKAACITLRQKSCSKILVKLANSLVQKALCICQLFWSADVLTILESADVLTIKWQIPLCLVEMKINQGKGKKGLGTFWEEPETIANKEDKILREMWECVSECVCVCLCVWVSERMCVCVCVSLRDEERETRTGKKNLWGKREKKAKETKKSTEIIKLPY